MEDLINPEQLLVRIAGVLNELNFDYVVTGGFAVSVWGRPRATFDIDIVIKLVESDARLLAESLRKISRFGYIDEETAVEAIKKSGEFNFIDPETGLKVDFWVKGKDFLGSSEYGRKVSKDLDGIIVNFISPEDLILSKLKWYKETQSSRHLEDIESVFKISGDILDQKYLNQNLTEEDKKLLEKFY